MERLHLTDAQIEEHRKFITDLGISEGDVDAAVQMMRSMQSDRQFAWAEASIPLLPAPWIIRHLKAMRLAIERRPAMHGIDDGSYVSARLEFYALAAIIMDMRASRSDPDAGHAAKAMREYIEFLRDLATDYARKSESGDS